MPARAGLAPARRDASRGVLGPPLYFPPRNPRAPSTRHVLEAMQSDSAAAPPPPAGDGSAPDLSDEVVRGFRQDEHASQNESRPILAIRALLRVLEKSRSTTMHGLQEELETATTALLEYADSDKVLVRTTMQAQPCQCRLSPLHELTRPDPAPGPLADRARRPDRRPCR